MQFYEITRNVSYRLNQQMNCRPSDKSRPLIISVFSAFDWVVTLGNSIFHL